MKKTILVCLLSIIKFVAYSQCTPDPSFTSPGVYPDSATNFSAAFEDGLTLNGFPIIVDGKQVEILPGLKKYRLEHNFGSLVFDARIGYEFKEHYRLGFMVNNVLNAEYSSRPGDIQAPRTFMVQVQMKF